jgi:alpha-beta hydrolase superfamily lysophospholipase
MNTLSQTATPGVRFMDEMLERNGEPSLFLRSAVLEGNKADVLLTHGLGEHCARYEHVGVVLSRRGYRLCTYDLRGHGRSGGRRGHVNRYSELMDDLDVVLHHHRRDGSGVPLFLYGHSLGAQITLNYLLVRRPSVAGAVLTSPWLALALRPAWPKKLLARMMFTVWPTFTQNTFNNPAALSRDLDFLASLPRQDLRHDKMSARMYGEVVATAARIARTTDGFGCPLLLIHGADDLLTSAAATEAFFNNLAGPDKTLKILPGMRHETQNEIGRETVVAEVVQWLDAHMPGGAS